jgi:hypothetical protein
LGPQLHRIDAFDIMVFIDDVSVNPAIGNQIIHPVEASEDGTLSAPAWPYESRDHFLIKIKIDVLQNLFFTVG